MTAPKTWIMISVAFLLIPIGCGSSSTPDNDAGTDGVYPCDASCDAEVSCDGSIEPDAGCDASCPASDCDAPCECDACEAPADAGCDAGCPPVDLDTDDDGDPDETDCAPLDANIHAGAVERCDGLDNDCDGNTDDVPGCGSTAWGAGVPLSMEDFDLITGNVGLDGNGDVILKKELDDYRAVWIANTYDAVAIESQSDFRGTVSRIDSLHGIEVARYLTVTCSNEGYSAANCQDVNGNPVQLTYNNPSRIAVTPEGNAWVANRAHQGGQPNQPSVSLIAYSEDRCVDRNGDEKITTSHDANGNGIIDMSNPEEFPGLDDECVLFTANFGADGYIGRSVAADDEGNAWVGTYRNGLANYIYRVTPEGSLTQEVDDSYNLQMPIFNLTLDRFGILWATDIYDGSLFWLNTADTAEYGQLDNPFTSPEHDGISVDDQQNIWLGGWSTKAIYRFKPTRDNDGVPTGSGEWAKVNFDFGLDLGYTRSVAIDPGGFAWTAHSSTGGFISRTPLNLLTGGNLEERTVSQANGGLYVKTAGDNASGVGLDVFGQLWAASYDTSKARRFHVDEARSIPVDGAGNPTGIVLDLPTGSNPFPYGDFTGSGRLNFVIRYPARGSYRRRVSACQSPGVPVWKSVTFTASKPSGSNLQLWIRSGDDAGELAGQAWQGPWDASPVDIQVAASPNPARFLELKFELTSPGDVTPVLEQFGVTWECQ